MKNRFLLSLLAASLSVTLLHAADEEDEYSPELGIYASAKNSIKFGFRMVGGAKVHFGNLGNVPFASIVAPASDGEVNRKYSNGIVNKDALRTQLANLGGPEINADGTLVPVVNGRYNTTQPAADGTVTITGDFLAFKAGQTRSWNYNSDSQVVPGGIRMDSFSATSDGANFEGKKQSSSGIEFQLERVLGKLGGKWEVSIVGGIALSGISNKQSGNVHSTLRTLSDTFSLLGQPAPPINSLGQPTFIGFDLGGGAENPSGTETTTPLASVPSTRTDTSAVGAANVAGVWRIKGAYYTMKVGPEVRTNFTKDFGMSASIGVAGAYVGTNYSAIETLTVDGIASPIVSNEPPSTLNKFLPGYYANIDALWQANERTGFFAGISYEQFGDYNQSFGGRTAKIDLGGTAGVRGGISIKF